MKVFIIAKYATPMAMAAFEEQFGRKPEFTVRDTIFGTFTADQIEYSKKFYGTNERELVESLLIRARAFNESVEYDIVELEI
jgi:hypothetical protein